MEDFIKDKIKLNNQFGYWTVIKENEILNNKKRYVLCRCCCGKERYIYIYKLLNNATKSCGCKRRILVSQANEKRLGRTIPNIGYKHFFLEVISEPIYLKKFGRNRIFIKCKCVCGNEKLIRTDILPRIKSCGCKSVILRTQSNKNKIKHGGVYTKLYEKWCSMKGRCYNVNNKQYPIYGGKGIKLCENWLRFKNFQNWSLNNGYKENLTIDRIDPDKDYYPENCQYITREENSKRVFSFRKQKYKNLEKRVQFLEQQLLQLQQQINSLQEENNNLKSQLINFKNNQNLVFV